MPETTIATWLKIDRQGVTRGLQEAAGKLDSAQGEMILDFSDVIRIGPGDLRQMEKLAGLADDRVIKVGLRGVNIDIYKVLKLMKLAPRFSFLT